MVTQSSGLRRLGTATKARLAFAANAVMGRRSRQLKRALLTEQHRLHFDLLCKAMDDPALTAVLDTYESDIPLEKQRQYLFANALYVNALYFHRLGAMSRVELHGHLRVMCRNKIFREYWEATRHHRESLPYASEEAELGRMTDKLVQEMDNLLHTQDQDDGDLEEWWVVDSLPDE
ncbi:DUF6082 family protein [Streptomyces sp. NPDC001795]|uniref:DUF6082 family protein n=1 Tax=unclassified Streptomyces TaxID=2593676 RepID=UPI00332505E9